MALGSKTIARSLEVALEAGSRAKDFAAALQAQYLKELAPFLDEGRELPDIAYFVELLGRRLKAQSEELSVADLERQNRASVTGFHKERERTAAAAVRKLLSVIRFTLDETIGKAKAKQNFEGRDGLGKLTYPVMVRVGERLVTLLREESIDWASYPVDDVIPSRIVLSDKLETALSEFKQILESSRPDRSELSRTDNYWKRERVVKTKRLGSGRRLVQAFLIDVGLELEAAELSPPRRKSTPAKGEAPGGEVGTKVSGMSGNSEGAPWPGMKPGVGAVLAPGPESAASQCN